MFIGGTGSVAAAVERMLETGVELLLRVGSAESAHQWAGEWCHQWCGYIKHANTGIDDADHACLRVLTSAS